MDDSEPNRSSTDEPPPPVGGSVVEVQDRTGRLRRDDAAWIEARALDVLAAMGRTGEVCVTVLDDAAMAAAHSSSLGIDDTTDVLTFDHAEDGATAIDAEVLVCLDEAGRQAASRGHETRRELLLYVVHALLHVCGHDDADEAAASRMHAEEDRLLRAVGVGAVFAVSEAGGAS